MANLKFYRGAEPTSPAAGYIWFDKTNSTIKVYTGTAWESYAGKLVDATWDSTSKALTLVKQDGTSSKIDFSDVASATSLTDLTDRVKTLEGKHASGKTVAQEAAAAVSGIAAVSKSNTAGADVVVTVSTESGSVSSVAVDASVLAKKVSDEASARKFADDALLGKSNDAATANTIYGAKAYADELVKTSVASVYRVKGSCTYAKLPTEGQVTGDVWNVTDANGNTPAGTNYVWNGEDWDALGGTIDLSPYAKKAELVKSDAAVAGQVVSAVSESNGIISVTRRALVAADIPTLAISKVSGLQTALDGKMAASATGADINVGGDGAHKAATIATSVEDLYTKVASAAASGVTAFGGKTGAITLTAGSGSYPITLAMTNNALGATISGLGTAAAKAVGDFDAAGAAAKVLGDKAKDTAASETVYGAIAKAAAAQSAASAASAKVDTSIQALDADVDNSATATSAGTADSTQIKVSVSEVDGKLTGVSVVAPAFDTAGTASSAIKALNVTSNTSASVKGVTVTVNESAGKVSKPVVAIADGAVASGNGNLVTGGQVYTAIENHVASTLAWEAFE